MSATWITADLHLGHRKIIEYEPLRQYFVSIEEHDETIEANWRDLVRKHDVVYVVGDVAWNRKALERFRSFPGRKKLVMGNHDRLDMQEYLRCFVKVLAYAELDGYLVAHVPVDYGSLVPRFKGQIHGHTHSHGSPEGPYVSVCQELWDFRPVILERVVKEFI